MICTSFDLDLSGGKRQLVAARAFVAAALCGTDDEGWVGKGVTVSTYDQ